MVNRLPIDVLCFAADARSAAPETLAYDARSSLPGDADRDAVRPPLARQRARQRGHGALAGMVGGGLHAVAAAQRRNGGDVDDPAAAAPQHAAAGHLARQKEDAAHIEVHHLVRGVQRVVLRRRAPGGAGVVHQDVDGPQLRQGVVDQRQCLRLFAPVRREGIHPVARRAQFGSGLVEVALLSGGDQQAGACFAERMRHLQAQPPPANRR